MITLRSRLTFLKFVFNFSGSLFILLGRLRWKSQPVFSDEIGFADVLPDNDDDAG